MSEGELQQKVCSICPNCVEEPCRLDSGDFCATCTDILKLVAQQCAAARIDELETLQKLHTRTHHQTVTDNVGNVYVDDSYAYISAYETQERIAHLRQADTTPKAAPHDHNVPDGAERNV